MTEIPEELVEFARDTLTMNTNELCKKYRRAFSTIRERRTKCRNLGLEVGYGNADRVIYKDRRDLTGASGEDLFRFLLTVEAKWEEHRPQQTELALGIKEDLPIGIFFAGDFQVGLEGVDYLKMQKDFFALGKAEGIHGIGMGDYAHNPKVGMGGRSRNLYRMILTHCTDQYAAITSLMQRVDSWLALVIGCHDDWSRQIDDYDPVLDLCEELDAAHLWHGGEIKVTVGEELYSQAYTIRVRHKFKYESSLNVTNALRQMFDHLGPADVLCLAHKHFPTVEKLPRWGGKKDTVYLRSGSYLRLDEYGQKLAQYEGIAGIPVVILYPDEKKVVPFYGKDMDVALRTLKSERRRYENRNAAKAPL